MFPGKAPALLLTAILGYFLAYVSRCSESDGEAVLKVTACDGKEHMCCPASGCEERVCLNLTNPVNGSRVQPQFRGSGTDTSIITRLQTATGDLSATIAKTTEGFQLLFVLNTSHYLPFTIQAFILPNTGEKLFSPNFTIYQYASPPQPTVKSATLLRNTDPMKLIVKIQVPILMPADKCLSWRYKAYVNGTTLRFLEQTEEDASLVLAFEIEDRHLASQISQQCVNISAVGDTGLRSNSICVKAQVESSDTESFDWIAGAVLGPVGSVIALVVVVVVVVIVSCWYCHSTHKKTIKICKLNEVRKSPAASTSNSLASMTEGEITASSFDPASELLNKDDQTKTEGENMKVPEEENITNIMKAQTSPEDDVPQTGRPWPGKHVVHRTTSCAETVAMKTESATVLPPNEMETKLDAVLPQMSSCVTPGMPDKTNSWIEPEQTVGSVHTLELVADGDTTSDAVENSMLIEDVGAKQECVVVDVESAAIESGLLEVANNTETRQVVYANTVCNLSDYV